MKDTDKIPKLIGFRPSKEDSFRLIVLSLKEPINKKECTLAEAMQYASYITGLELKEGRG